MPDFLRKRIKALPAFMGFAAVGGLLAWFGLSKLLAIVHAIEVRAPLITFGARDAVWLPLALSFFALGAMTLFPMPEIGPRRRNSSASKGQRFDGAALCLLVAVAGAVLSALVSPITQIVVESTLVHHGYLQCPWIPFDRLSTGSTPARTRRKGIVPRNNKYQRARGLPDITSLQTLTGSRNVDSHSGGRNIKNFRYLLIRLSRDDTDQ